MKTTFRLWRMSLRVKDDDEGGEDGTLATTANEEEEEKLVSRDKRHVFWSEDECAEKADRGERFVEFDREVRRYLFHTHSSEIECD